MFKKAFQDFVQLGRIINGVKNIDTGSQAGINILAKSIANLSAQQQVLILSTKNLSKEQIEQILISNKISKENIEQALSTSALTNEYRVLTTETAKEILMSNGLSKSKAMSIMRSTGLTAATKNEAIAKEEVSIVTLQARLAQAGLNDEQIQAIMTEMGLASSTATLSAMFKGLTATIWSSVKAIGAFLISNPVGWCILAGTAITGVVAIISGLNTSLEEQKEISQELEGQYAELSSEISNLEQKLTDTKDRIDELNKLDTLTFIEQEELDNLEAANIKLERQNEILKENQEIKGKEVRKSIEEEYRKDFQSSSDNSNREWYIQQWSKQYKDLKAIEQKIVNGDFILSEEQNIYDKNKDKIDEYRQYLVESAQDISDYIARLQENGASDDDPFLQELQKDFEEIDRVLNPSAYKTIDFSNIINADEFSNDVSEINNLVSSHALTITELQEKYPALTQALLDGGFTVEECVSQFYALNRATSNTSKNAQNVTADIKTLSDSIESITKKTSTFASALSEIEDNGYISAETYANLIELNTDYAKCFDVVDGKIKLIDGWRDKLKDIEAQEYFNAKASQIAARAELSLAMAREQAAGKFANGERIAELQKLINAVDLELAAIDSAYADLFNVTADDDGGSGGKDETPTEIQNFLDAYAKYHHDINMGLKEEDSEYFDWLEKASAEAYASYPEYLEDLWKYEEEVYAGRKQLIQDYFDTQRELMDENISALEEKIDTFSNESVGSDGNFLNPKEKFSEIRSAYTEILTYIQTLIDEIVQSGVEGHEEELAELEKQYEEYSDKLGDVFKDEINSEIEYLEWLQEEQTKVYDERIDALEKEKSAIEERYDAEIKKLQDKNDEEKRTNDLIKARQDLEKAKRNKRLVFDSNGNMIYTADTEAVNEAEQSLKDVETEIKIEELEKQKESATATIDDEIEVLKEQKAAQESYYSALLNILEAYLNPKSTQSIESVWEKILSDPNVTVKDGSIDVKGQNVDTTAVTDGKVNAGTVSKELNKKPNLTQSEQDVFVKLLKSAGMSQQDITDVLKGKTKIYDLLKQPAQNNLNSVERYTNTKKEFGTVNNTDNGVNITIGDIKIDNPVGDTMNLAKEIQKQLPNAIVQQIYKNR